MAMLQESDAPGRPFVLHTTDEDIIEQAPQTPYAADAPPHVIALRTATGKLGLYSRWVEGSLEIDPEDADREYYDLLADPLELTNVRDASDPAYQAHQALMAQAFDQELRAPLPAWLQPVQAEAFAAYLEAHGRNADGARSAIYLPWASWG
jgi:hypothetical protein